MQEARLRGALVGGQISSLDGGARLPPGLTQYLRDLSPAAAGAVCPAQAHLVLLHFVCLFLTS